MGSHVTTKADNHSNVFFRTRDGGILLGESVRPVWIPKGSQLEMDDAPGDLAQDGVEKPGHHLEGLWSAKMGVN